MGDLWVGGAVPGKRMSWFKAWCGREPLSDGVTGLRFPPAHGDAPTVVIANGIPKSGTHLLYELVKALGGWVGTDIHLNQRNYDRKDTRGYVLERVRARWEDQLASV